MWVVEDCTGVYTLASALARFGKVGREATNQKVESSSPSGRSLHLQLVTHLHNLRDFRRDATVTKMSRITSLIGLFIRSFEVLSNLVNEPQLTGTTIPFLSTSLRWRGYSNSRLQPAKRSPSIQQTF